MPSCSCADVPSASARSRINSRSATSPIVCASTFLTCTASMGNTYGEPVRFWDARTCELKRDVTGPNRIPDAPRRKAKTQPPPPPGSPARKALDYAIQAARGLAAAHDIGIVHRDLKPENLIISRDGYAKILDFGLAKLVERRQRAATANSADKTLVQVKTQAGMIMGTVNYMSPEQLLGQRVDLRSDIFSFGIVLYEMATGQCPFANENKIDLGLFYMDKGYRNRPPVKLRTEPGVVLKYVPEESFPPRSK